MVNACSANGCNNKNDKGCNLTFHRFPLNNKELLKVWLYQIKRGTWEPSKYSVLCSAHFTEDSFVFKGPNNRRTLKKDAIPTNFTVANYMEPPKKIRKTDHLRNRKRGGKGKGKKKTEDSEEEEEEENGEEQEEESSEAQNEENDLKSESVEEGTEEKKQGTDENEDVEKEDTGENVKNGENCIDNMKEAENTSGKDAKNGKGNEEDKEKDEEVENGDNCPVENEEKCNDSVAEEKE